MICTKWPLLLVVGEPVTEEQANEILIRTHSWYWLSANDRAWQQQVRDLAAEFGYPPEIEREFGPGYDHDAFVERNSARFRDLMAWTERHKILGLEYLTNDQIMSAWIGGPHGWCDWSGRIGTSNYNIGKWPSSEEVTEEWQTIAEAFPYLTLTAQAVDDEGEGRLAGEWRVHNGTVRYIDEPTERIAEQTPVTELQMVRSVLLPGGERGVSLDRLRAAFEQVCS